MVETMQNRLTRNEADKRIAGVCSGLADYINVDPVLVRVAFGALAFIGGAGVWLYALMAVLMPSDISIGSASIQDNVRDARRSVGDSWQTAQAKGGGDRLLAWIALIVVISAAAEFISWINVGTVLPVALIGLGIWLIVSRRKKSA